MQPNMDEQPVQEAVQQTDGIIRMSTGTKVLYSLFNFFAPVSMTALFINQIEIYSVWGTLLAFLSMGIGLFCVLYNLFKYNRFLKINGRMIQVCRANPREPQVLETVFLEEGIMYKMDKNFTLSYQDKKVKLLKWSPSLFGEICWLGPLVLIVIGHYRCLVQNKEAEIAQILPQLFEKAPQALSRGNNILMDVLLWGFVIFIGGLGLLGMLISPFYAFMQAGA